MVEVEMTKDIRDYEPKLFGLVTTRQIIVLSIGIAYAAPIALLIPTDFANQCMIAVFLMLPMILIGWVSVYGMRMETCVIQVVRSMLLSPRQRKYERIDSAEYLKDETKEKKKKIITSEQYPAHR